MGAAFVILLPAVVAILIAAFMTSVISAFFIENLLWRRRERLTIEGANSDRDIGTRRAVAIAALFMFGPWLLLYLPIEYSILKATLASAALLPAALGLGTPRLESFRPENERWPIGSAGFVVVFSLVVVGTIVGSSFTPDLGAWGVGSTIVVTLHAILSIVYWIYRRTTSRRSPASPRPEREWRPNSLKLALLPYALLAGFLIFILVGLRVALAWV